jgi:hypothetical protein
MGSIRLVERPLARLCGRAGRVRPELPSSAERTDRVKVAAVGPVAPAEVLRVILANGPRAVRAVDQGLRLRHYLANYRGVSRFTASPKVG